MSDTDTAGRPSFAIPNKGYFEAPGIDGILLDPKEFEAAHDGDTKALGMYIKNPETGLMEFKSYILEIAQKLQELETAGVLENARAFRAMKQINTMFFDVSPSRRTVKINPELRFSSSYRYFAIRTDSLPGGAAPEYLTGRVDGEGNVLSFHVDMDIVEAETGEGFVSVPAAGSLLPNAVMQDKMHYIVEFFDTQKTLVNALPFHAIAVKAMALDMTPDAAATRISITTANFVEGDVDACYLYVNTSFEDLDLMVNLHYTDGSYKNITHELANGGRLQFVDEEKLTTVDPTPQGEEPQKFIVRYFLDGTNATPEGVTLSLDLEVKVFIREDESADLFKVIPVYWVESASNSVKAEFFGLYKSGQLNKISHRLEDNSPAPLPSSIAPVNGYSQPTNAKFLYGEEGQNLFILDYTMKLTEDAGDSGHYLADITRTGNNGDLEKRTMNYNPTEGTFGLIVADMGDPIGELRNENTYVDAIAGISDVPTHIRVRTIDGYYFTNGVVPLASYAGFLYNQLSVVVPNKDIPLIVEFVKVENIESEDIITRVCYARPYYRNVTATILMP